MRETIILQRMKAGDPSGLEALMACYLPYISVIVWNILRSAMTPQDGEEVVADVFLAAWNQASDLKAGHVKGWLGAVARNKAKNKLRELGKTIPLEESVLELPGTGDPADDVERAEEQALVRQAVDALPPEDREVFLRHYYYAQTVREISACMGLKESTVKTKLRRGRIKLKELLSKEGSLNET
ncbi:RNA polymerase sigma factor [Pseudoflavonifractor phocaeensis]|uniref:RNA polymerase sigma factor n=1 Tax=Pseudoflavonifractor phocaeensis TaxID=1870988 RepID=UPI00195B5D63|nr:RNA polymerase sigma factor [Pseudoflavonifractor phocaeensis]MBM6869994.1 RNA polymerase sigma factor [Pseudoflavonifractor phocaeensis]MBM6937722.1 RNA polymerase sigma factor [Pseudoflavonifractor phocaeensis]